MTNPEKGHTPEEPSSPSKWDVLVEYDKNQRSRVEKLKQQLREDEWPYNTRSRFEREKIDTPPSTFQKFGRSVLDFVNLTIPVIEKRRDREAMSTAIREIKADEDEKEVKRQMGMAQEDTASGVRQIIEKEKKEREDKELLGEQLSVVHQQAEQKKHDKFVSERVQELVEREINEKLLKVETLEEEVFAENPEIQKRTIKYEGSDITVYDLKGLPFSILTTAIDYRHDNIDDPEHIGVQTMNKLLENPSMWAETEEIAKKSEGYGTRNGNARGNVISTSYTNSDSNLGGRLVNPQGYTLTVYGFSKLPGDSIIDVFYQDGGTSNDVGHAPTRLDKYDLDAVDILEGPNNRISYNEILLRRYDETGKPILPDYIVAENGVITDTMKRHAAYFGIPIINIDTESYTQKGEKNAMEALETIDENTSYKDISEKIDAAKKIDYFNYNLNPLEKVGDGSEYNIIESGRSYAKNEKDKEIVNIVELEIKKRLDFIENEIKRCIEEVKKANEKGEKYEYNSDVLEYFNTVVYNNESGIGSMDHSKIDIRFKGSTRTIKTTLYDGEHRHEAEEFYKDYPSQRERHYDSSAYEKITPLLLEYHKLLKENNNLARR